MSKLKSVDVARDASSDKDDSFVLHHDNPGVYQGQHDHENNAIR